MADTKRNDALGILIDDLNREYDSLLTEERVLAEQYNRTNSDYIHGRTEQARCIMKEATRIYALTAASESAWGEYINAHNLDRAYQALNDGYARRMEERLDVILAEIKDDILQVVEQVKQQQN